MLLYLAKLYQNSIPSDDLLYKEAIIQLPKPEFYVFYNGEQEYPEINQLQLSDAWDNSSAPIELTVTVYNINYGHNKALEEKCHALMEYAYFISRINHHKETHSLDDAIIIAMKDCLNLNYMSDYLSKHKSEVTDLMRIRYSRKDEIAYKAREAAEKAAEKAAKEATEKTALQKDLSSIKNLMETMSLTAEAAMKALKIPSEKIPTYTAML